MAFEQKLQEIAESQRRILQYGQVPDDVLKKVNYKLTHIAAVSV